MDMPDFKVKGMILLKIERLSENQIRCTLNKADLAEKELKISELAYGTAKAKALFKEMMQQASIELGFEVDDIPLMIEAIPVSPDCLILIVTKVEDPEELDTRFSRFSKVSEIDFDDDTDDSEDDFYADDEAEASISQSPATDSSVPPEAIFDAIEGLVNTISGLAANKAAAIDGKAINEATEDVPVKKTTLFRVFVFDSIATVIKAAKQVAGFYFGTNTLYKNPANNKFYLLITMDNNSSAEFSRACNIIGEYGSYIKSSYAAPYHYKEHFKTIVSDDAIMTLSAL